MCRTRFGIIFGEAALIFSWLKEVRGGALLKMPGPKLEHLLIADNRVSPSNRHDKPSEMMILVWTSRMLGGGTGGRPRAPT